MNPVAIDRDDIRVVHFVRDPNGRQLDQIAKLVDDGVISAGVDAIYQLTDARAAYMAKATHHIPGKVVLKALTEQDPSRKVDSKVADPWRVACASIRCPDANAAWSSDGRTV